jgi:hypothetical protein
MLFYIFVNLGTFFGCQMERNVLRRLTSRPIVMDLGFSEEDALVVSLVLYKQHRGHDLPNLRPHEGKPYVLLVCFLIDDD